MRALIGEKMGMTQVFDDEARAIPVTVIKAGPCQVVQIRRPEKDGYAAIQLAYGEKAKVTKPEAGHFAKAGVQPARNLVEVRVEDPDAYQVGQTLQVGDLFQPGMRVDVTGTSKGKGFQGVMKRHNFSGQGASHGNHKKHRAPGSIGACATPSRVFKGKRMPGRMGGERVTVLNLRVVEVLEDRDLILVEGAVPGPNGGMVLVREAVKSPVGGETR
ncbi:MAG: 50S ribosomal protein L3 [Acidimicrobiia bacterium]|nr:MAG: 50S ribosomal protein L3 [Acidimicrobiia bacterium]